MPKIPDCDCAPRTGRANRCLFYSHNPLLICSVHPSGVETDNCIDFRPDPNIELEEQWTPAGYSWYGGELIPNKLPKYTSEQQIEMLDTHPFFTGVCPNCKHQFDRTNHQIIHFDCTICGWTDDSI